MNFKVQFSILQFVLLSKASLPYSKTLINLSRLSDDRDLPILIK